MKTKEVFRKSLDIKESGRSSDFISPSFIYECALNCSYCYVKRHGVTVITIAKNVGDLLTAINNHVTWLPEKKPNQTHPVFYTYDIGCNSDIGLHRKQLKWKSIFDFFKNHHRAMGTFATKIVPEDFLSFNPERKVRIRFSLMPQKYSSILEPNTSSIKDRITAVNKFIEAGYDVHLNFSPVIVTDNWLYDYKILFNQVNKLINDDYKSNISCEVIFLTHNKQKHDYNVKNSIPGEDMLWNPEVQEDKISNSGDLNIRYKVKNKTKWINQFKELHSSMIDWCDIRYIF